ncbi:Complement factor H, partial [Larimichthys crocea]
CTLKQFLESNKYDENFDTSNLDASYPPGKQFRVSCNVGYTGFFKLICTERGWETRGTKCELKSCGHPGDAQFADFALVQGDDFVFGSRVVYTCQKGYQMVSRTSSRQCMAGGWDGVVPVCEAQQCPAIHVDGNVLVTGDPDEATFGNVVRFSCKSNTEMLEGPVEIYCDENGAWSAEAPKCKEITCEIPVIENGFVHDKKLKYNEKDVLHFTCNPSFKPAEVRPSTCAKFGSRAEWSPTPLCEPIKCKLSVALEGTSYDPAYRNVFSPGDTLRVNCGEKYWISQPEHNSAVTTCNPDGEWTIRPVCQEVRCSTRQPHVYRFSIYWGQIITMDETVGYSCRGGYKSPDGRNLATCTRKGWRPDPLCQETACTKPSISNGFVVGPINQTVFFACNEGYKLFTKGWWGAAKCDGTEWSVLDRCIAKSECGKTPVIANGEVAEETGQIKCNNGYQQEVDNLTCQDGKWTSGGIPLNAVCRSIGTHCKAPRRVENAVVLSAPMKEYLSDSSVTYQCHDNYTMVGENTILCKNGTWEQKSIHCTGLPDVPNAYQSEESKKAEYFGGDVIYFRCEIGYISGLTIRYVCSGGRWLALHKRECFLKPCKLPDDTPNGYFRIIHGEDFVFGTTIRYFCNEGYHMVSKEDTRTCLVDKWTNHVPICDPLTCDPPPADEWLTVSGVPENGEAILPDRFLTFSCNRPGKYLNGSSMVICGRDGNWNTPFPSCEEITCKVHMMHHHLIVTGLQPGDQTVKTGHKLQFQCRNNFVLEGREEIDCLETGQWNADFPTCTENCKVGDVPSNVYTIPSLHQVGHQLRKGEKLKFVCSNRRHILRGNAEVECLQDGQWSDSFPTCADPVGCNNPPALVDGDTVTSLKYQYSHGERVQYTCQDYYIMEGSPYRTCSNGQWTGEMRCLKPCTVNKEIMDRHNIVFRFSRKEKLYSRHNQEAEFMCSGRTTHDRAAAMRQRCVDACSTLPDVPHAFVSDETKKDEYQEGDVIDFTCGPGYTSSQPSKYVCTRDGWLAVRQGKCYSCSPLPDVPHALVSDETKKDEYREGDMIDFTCEPGYTSSQTSKYVCTRDGWMAARQGTCYLLTTRCDPPPAGSFIVKGLPENDEPIGPDHIITVSCDGPGKHLNGSSVLICGEDGQWNTPFPSCIENCKVGDVPRQCIHHPRCTSTKKRRKVKIWLQQS